MRAVKFVLIEDGTRSIYAEERGPNSWAITTLGFVMNKEGRLEHEPMSSSRDEAFLSRCRFKSPEECLEMAEKHPINFFP